MSIYNAAGMVAWWHGGMVAWWHGRSACRHQQLCFCCSLAACTAHRSPASPAGRGPGAATRAACPPCPAPVAAACCSPGSALHRSRHMIRKINQARAEPLACLPNMPAPGNSTAPAPAVRTLRCVGWGAGLHVVARRETAPCTLPGALRLSTDSCTACQARRLPGSASSPRRTPPMSAAGGSEDGEEYVDALGVITALERTNELESRLRQAVQDTHPLTTTLDWDFNAADQEREALLAIRCGARAQLPVAGCGCCAAGAAAAAALWPTSLLPHWPPGCPAVSSWNIWRTS